MTRVEAIVLAVETLLRGAYGVDGAGAQKEISVFVNRVSPMTRDDAPAVDINANTEDAQAYGAANHLGRETLRNVFRLELAIYTRGDPPLLVGERNFSVIHQRLMKDRTLGGLARVVRYANRRWTKGQADESTGWLVASYDITYLTSDHDLA